MQEWYLPVLQKFEMTLPMNFYICYYPLAFYESAIFVEEKHKVCTNNGRRTRYVRPISKDDDVICYSKGQSFYTF